MKVHRGALLLVALVGLMFVVVARSADASSPASQLKPHLRRLRYDLGIYPMTSGDYALLSINTHNPASVYLVIDDKTHRQTRVTAPSGCQMWGSAPFAAPWIVFACVQGNPFRLYNVASHRWRALDCGVACENIGLAAPEAFGRDWMEVNEEAYCDPRATPCPSTTAFVSLPDGHVGTFHPAARHILDLNSPTLSRKVCAPLSMPPSGGSLEFIGRFAVETTAKGDMYLEKCGSHLHRLLNAALPNSGNFVTANSHAVVTCSAPGYGSRNPPSKYSGVFLPSLKRFAFDLPAGLRACGATVDNNALYVGDSSETYVWAAPLPTTPPKDK